MSLDLITDGLNKEQKEAVVSESPALLVLAGAGSGKTRVLTRRISYLLAQGKIAPNEFLAVTFTNKAAFEMKERIVDLLGELGFPPPSDMWVSTFHAMGARILREHIYLLDYPGSFTIYDADDQLKAIKAVLKELNMNDKTVSPKSIREGISKAKSECLYPDQVEQLENIIWIQNFPEVYKKYEEKLASSKALDFSDLLFKTFELLQSYPDVLAQYKGQFKHILVDEYQDTNSLQYKLIHLLADGSSDLFAVGDEDQSIYSWRGANTKNISHLERDFSSYLIKLEQNYRSTQNIVHASNELIKNNTERKPKTLFTDNVEGEKIKITETNNEYDEAKLVASQIQNLIDMGEDPNDITIFYRMNSQSRVLEEQLRMKTIAHRILGGLRFYERKEIKDILAFFKLAANPRDEISILRVINVPRRGIGKTTMERLIEKARDMNVSLFEAMEQLEVEPFLKPSPRAKVLGFLKIVKKLIEIKDQPITEVYRELLDLTGYVIQLKAENSSEADARINNLEELDNALTYFEQERESEATLDQFLEETALVAGIDEADFDTPMVTLMTLHVSKGLEFEHAFIVGLEEGMLPCVRSDDKDDPEEIEEERRLAYVGMTRAKKTLTMTYARTRKVWGQDQYYPVSRFIDEIPDDYAIKSSLAPSPSKSGSWRSGSSTTGEYGNSYASQKYRKQEVQADPFPDYESYSDDHDGETFRKGTRVKHPVFGHGSILEVEGSGELMKVKIVFNDQSVKKFVAKYARLELA